MLNMLWPVSLGTGHLLLAGGPGTFRGGGGGGSSLSFWCDREGHRCFKDA